MNTTTQESQKSSKTLKSPKTVRFSNNPIVIVIDGEIGAGKTTLIKILTKELTNRFNLNVCPIYEPVRKWRAMGVLEMFYQNIQEKCYEFQTFTFVTRVKSTLDAVKRNPNADLYILERSILTDRYVFVEMLKEQMGPIRMKMYDEWWDMWHKIMPFEPSAVVYLDTRIEDSTNRIVERNRKEEQDAVDINYQRNLKAAHQKFISQINYPTPIISSDMMAQNFITDEEARNSIVEEFYRIYLNEKSKIGKL